MFKILSATNNELKCNCLKHTNGLLHKINWVTFPKSNDFFIFETFLWISLNPLLKYHEILLFLFQKFAQWPFFYWEWQNFAISIAGIVFSYISTDSIILAPVVLTSYFFSWNIFLSGSTISTTRMTTWWWGVSMYSRKFYIINYFLIPFESMNLIRFQYS